jgi:hypothetical protein
MKNRETICPICGCNNYNSCGDNALRTNDQYRAAVIALKAHNLPIAEGHTDEALHDSIESGCIDPWTVCHNCYTDDDGELL